jgi:hypothetical protein
VPVPVFCCFCISEKLHRKYSRNWTKRKPNLLFFLTWRWSPKQRRRRARGWPHHRVARVTPWPRHQVVWAPGPPSDIALPPALDLPYVKYHTYINDCALYRDEYAERTTCPVCGQGRYNIGNKKVPQKVVWYFPITPRQQRYFVDLRKQSSSDGTQIGIRAKMICIRARSWHTLRILASGMH